MDSQLIPTRRLDDWIAQYLHFTPHHEAPTSYHMWSALTVLAASVNRNIWMDWGYYKSFPNLYVLFVGPSGVGKSTSSGIAITLLRDANIKVPIYKDFITPQGLIQFMSEAKVRISTTKDTGKISYKTPCLIYASELGTLLSKTAGIQELTLVLTELFNKQGNYEYRTKGGGFIHVEKPNVTFWACCLHQWIDEELASAALRSGFLGRILIVVNQNRRFFNDNVTLKDKDLLLREDLIHDLKLIGSLYGSMDWTQEAEALWKEWYHSQETEFSQGDNIEVEGFLSRRAQFIQRLSMLLSISKRNDLIIHKDDLIHAMELVKECEFNTRNIGQTTVYFSNIQKLKRSMVSLSKLKKSLSLSLRDIMMRVSKFMKKVELEESLEQLTLEGFCTYKNQNITLFQDMIDEFERELSEVKTKKKEKKK